MPTKGKKICPYCQQVCNKSCRKPARNPDKNKLYGRQWKKFSRYYLSLNPLCVDCEAVGRTSVATETHHVHKVSQGNDIYNNEFMALCRQCHQVRTNRGE
ncbi:MAG: HNH endonuclease [Planctomycetaceae bacterium]|nr:HNH endonuclease [Planctomycetaceae bacterium]